MRQPCLSSLLSCLLSFPKRLAPHSSWDCLSHASLNCRLSVCALSFVSLSPSSVPLLTLLCHSDRRSPDAKNTQYSALIKQGDALLNRIQKLSKVVSF